MNKKASSFLVGIGILTCFFFLVSLTKPASNENQNVTDLLKVGETYTMTIAGAKPNKFLILEKPNGNWIKANYPEYNDLEVYININQIGTIRQK